jgi:hypothetical protein
MRHPRSHHAILVFRHAIFERRSTSKRGEDDSRLREVLRLANLTDKILKGAHPADIPFYQQTQSERIINLKTAKALRLATDATRTRRPSNRIKCCGFLFLAAPFGRRAMSGLKSTMHAKADVRQRPWIYKFTHCQIAVSAGWL